ncbi:MAG: class I SAM-dependent methyltransferase [Candidatus Omnitrophica bacterium]|nr:class I SAM-dependent methyltransferase [Candidatus Omnitrophota bacterium]
MKVKQDWWKDFFSKTYLITDARSVCDPKLTRKEVNLLEKTLKLSKDNKILDLCGGQGRHSLELAKKGYKDITVLDYSKYLIELGKRTTKKAGLKIKFLRSDARSTGLKKENFCAIFIMANSFGYFSQDKENFKVLKESYRLLRKKGKLLLDITDPLQAKKHLLPFSWHRATSDIIVCRRRRLRGDIIKAQELVISRKKGLIKNGLYCERLYPQDKITNLLKKAGFANIKTRNNLSLHENKSNYGLMATRMIVTALKP